MVAKKKDQLIDIVVFAVLLTAAAAVTLTLFSRQCVENMSGSGLYHADMKAYILEMQGLDSGYRFPYPVFFKLAALIHLFAGAELSVAIATMLLNCLSMVIVKVMLNKMTLVSLRERFPRQSWLAGVIISVLSVSLFFVSMVFPPPGHYLPGIKHNYLGVFTANPFHNATYMAARPFALLSFWWYVKLLDTYETDFASGIRDSVSWKVVKDYVLFSVFLLLATMTKPSFTIVLVGAAGLIMLFRLIGARFRNWKATLMLGLTFVPTFADLLYQFQGVFVPEEGAEGGIGFCFGRIWGLYCDNIPLAVGLAAGFPIFMLLTHFGECRRDTFCRFSWQIYGMSFLMTFLLYEKGFREPDFNFSWGYMYGIFFAFLGALVMLIRSIAGKRRPALLMLECLAFLWHLACGLYYFGGILQGKMYY